MGVGGYQGRWDTEGLLRAGNYNFRLFASFIQNALVATNLQKSLLYEQPKKRVCFPHRVSAGEKSVAGGET